MTRAESKYFHTSERMDEALLSLLLEKDFEYITVKDVCTRAGVNRSTFYLHYENTADLLSEAIDMINQRFQNSFHWPAATSANIAELPKEDLFFITDQWLLPWLEFVKENRRVYRAIHTREAAFGVESAYREHFRIVFSPVLSRYGVDESQHEYIMEFFRYGLTAVMMRWVESDCRKSTTEIADIIKLCVGAAYGKAE